MNDLNHKISSAVAQAFALPFTVGQRSCCGRVYVVVTSPDRKVIDAMAKACEAQGRLFLRKGPHGSRNLVYVGYDNADGRALAQGAVIAESLKAAGVDCYRDEYAD